jgi:hypothetical protein
VNGYRFRTRSYEEKRGNLKTTCTGVRTPGTDRKDYYGIVEQILELDFGKFLGCKPVMFKCHWFDPQVTKKDLKIGQVEIRQDSKYGGDDVYIVANRDAKQVYYLPWANQNDKRLAGWSLVQFVSPRGKAAVPNDDDYNFDPRADEFYQPEGLEGKLEIDIDSLMSMEVNNDIDEDEGDEVHDAEDLRILEEWQWRRDVVVEEDVDHDEDERELDNIDSDDDSTDDEDERSPAILPFVEIVSNPCNIDTVIYITLHLCFLYKYLQSTNTNCFNLCHCRHSTKCQVEDGRADRTSGPSTCTSGPSRTTWRPATTRSTWRPATTRRRTTRSLRWSRRPAGVGVGGGLPG